MKKTKWIAGIAVTGILLSSTMPVFAGNVTKEENVYINLGSNGEVEQIYVVNELTQEEIADIIDYGNYEEVRNLSTSEPIQKQGDMITVKGIKGTNYYQGNLQTKEMPWIIKVNYFLDEKEVQPQELAGKSGKLEIRISIQQNKNVNSTFFENYLLQTTLSFEKEKCKNIETQGATIANVGSKKQLTYNIFAGEEKEISIKADVTNFELKDGISFNGVVMSMAIDSLDTSVINDKVTQLRTGIVSLNNGTNQLQSGSAKYKSGINELANQTKNLPTQSNQILDGINQSLGGVQTIQQQISSSSSMTSEQKQQIVNQIIQNIDAGLSQDSNYQALQVANPQMATYIRQLLINTSTQTAQTISSTYETKTRQSMEQLQQGLQTLNNGLSTLSSEYGKMNSGLSTISSSISTLSNSYNDINNGINKVAQGTNTLNSKTQNLQSQVDENIDEILEKFKNTNYKPVSFVSEQNNNIKAVQFIIKTEGISILEQQKEEETQQEELSFWDKLMNLF